MDDKPISDHDLYLSLHGTLMALITALHLDGRLPECFFQQMTRSEVALYEEDAPDAARLIELYSKTLAAEFQIGKPSSE